MSSPAGALTRTPRRAWVLVTVVAGLFAIPSTVGVAVLLVHGRWMASLSGSLSVLAAYWFAMGAWRRTPWGLASAESAPPGPPVLSVRVARAYTVLATACVGALAVAVAVQALVLSR